MASGRGGAMGIVSMVLLGGALVLLFFVVLSGVTSTTPLNKTYFLQATTGGITGARPVSQWTYFYVCNAGNTDCGAPVPALPIGYAWIGGGTGAPPALLGSHGHDTTSTYYYYMWRFGWVFYLMALVCTTLAFFSAVFAFSRIGSFLGSFITFFAWFWMTLAASLMTAVFVQARNRFRSDGMDASIGRYAFGFTWGAWAAITLAAFLLLLGGVLGGSSGKRDNRDNRRSAPVAISNGNVGETSQPGNAGYMGFFKRQRHRGGNTSAFADGESQHRVKDEYA